MFSASPVLYANHEGVNSGRVVLHSDLNNFFASVECKRRPDLSGFPIAVCGSKKDRHGIVLAKNMLAKRCGVKTGQAIWQAKELCRDLCVVSPDYDEYLKYSRAVKAIYLSYSDMVESFGMDEAWIELTGNRQVETLQQGAVLAQKIRNRVKKETGLTVSIGVSDNKVFSKLASDYRKPDAVTIFGPDNYFDIVSRINVEEMLFVGRSTAKRLGEYGIRTIGGAAQANLMFIKSMFGKNGERIYNDACGFNTELVCSNSSLTEVKSIGNSVTLPVDLKGYDEVKRIFHALSEKVAYRMRIDGYLGTTVQISVRSTSLSTKEHQCKTVPTDNALELAKCAERLYFENYDEKTTVRSVGVRMTNLIYKNKELGQSELLAENCEKRVSRQKLDGAVDKIRNRFGKDILLRAVNYDGSIEEHRVGGFDSV